MAQTSSSRYRSPSKGWRILTAIFAVAALITTLLYVFHIMPFGFAMVDTEYLYFLLLVFLPLLFVYLPATAGSPREKVPWYDVLFMVLSIVASAYFYLQGTDIILKGWEMGAPPAAYGLSLVLWPLVIEASRRSGGLPFMAVVLVFSLYPLVTEHMPGFLWNPSADLHRLASFHSFSSESILGVPLHVFGELFFGYMAFALVIQRLNAAAFFNDMALALVGSTRAGNAKVAIVASSLFGSISGAPVANVMTTGTFTIPAMKREGMRPDMAGAVEACASTGGALMPPVMGAVAFIMAQFLQVPYFEVCVVAIVPITIYYICLFFQIDAYAARVGLPPMPITTRIPKVGETLWKNIHILSSFLILVLLLFFFRLSTQAPWIALTIAIILGLFRKETRLNPKTVFLLLEDFGRVLGEMMGIMAPVGMIIGSFVITGVAYSLPHEIVGLAGGSLPLMLLFGAVASFILGMGVTISACYIFLAIVLAPALVEGGFDIMAVHLFILYCGMMSYITPPVALSAFAASAISGASAMQTGIQSMKLGIATYILPFIFVYSPTIILRGGDPIASFHHILTCVLGIVIISGAFQGYFWGMGVLRVYMRPLLAVIGFVIALPSLTLELAGMGLFAIIFAIGYYLRHRENFLARPAPGLNVS